MRNIHDLERRAPEGFAFPGNLREWERTRYRAAELTPPGRGFHEPSSGCTARTKNRSRYRVLIELPDAVTITVRGALIDMDGVLISSTACDERCWLRWARIQSMEGRFVLKDTHGRRTKDTIRVLRPGLDAEVEQKLIEQIDRDR